MEASSSSLSALAPPVFDEENYQAWGVKMQVYMEGCDYWEAAEDDYEVATLLDNPTLNQIRHYKEMKTRKARLKLVCMLLFHQEFSVESWLVISPRMSRIS